MGAISVVGGFSALRLPETLHYKLPQTVEEGELFGKDFSIDDCLRCIPVRPELSKCCSLDDIELKPLHTDVNEETHLDSLVRRIPSRKLTRHGSFVDTQKDADGTMKMTYWF